MAANLRWVDGITAAEGADSHPTGGPGSYRFEPALHGVMCGASDAKTVGRRLNGHQGLRPRRETGIAVTIVRCGGCGLIYSNPRPVPEELGQHYDRPPEDYWDPGYFADDPGQFQYCMDTFRNLWRGRQTPRALDAGAGVGQTMAALQANHFETFGLEPSSEFRARAISNGIDGDRLTLSSVEEARYEMDSFDLISFSAVLEHLHDPAKTIERALEWLAPEGLIYVEVPSARWLIA